jgi:hypothetical protein
MFTGTEVDAAGSSEDITAAIAVAVVAIIYVALFCWLAVIGWAKHRRMEREAYYRHETEKKLIEKGEAGSWQILRLRDEEERTRWLRRREGFKVAGLVTTALGAGILVGLQMIDIGEYSFAGAGGIPLIIGAALLLYAYVLYPKYMSLDIESISPPSEENQNSRTA